MNKSIVGFFMMGAAYIGSTAFTSNNGTKIGNFAPDIEFKSLSDSSDKKLSNYQGSYLILNFWRSDEAQSRLMEKQYASALESRSENSTVIDLISINLDSDRFLANEIIRNDGLNTESQFYLGTDKKKVEKIFNVDSDAKSYLLNPSGEIIAINPSIDYIKSL